LERISAAAHQGAASECLKYSGIKAIIGKSFARIFYRNSINIGLPVIQSEEAAELLTTDASVEINLEEGIIKTQLEEISFPKYPDFVLSLIKHDGLINYIKSNKESKK